MTKPALATAAKELAGIDKAAKEKKPRVDVIREFIETVAVVLALVALLRMFVAEAFSIPTGSMGPTLLGANRRFSCPECGHVSTTETYNQATNSTDYHICGTICQNCRFPIVANVRSLNMLLGEYGDRVIVNKYGYEFGDPQRWDVVVFIYPAEGMGGTSNSYPSRTNFIKRLVGLPGEKIAFMYGDAYIRKPGDPAFQITAKTPAAMLATRRVVWDNDEQPKDLLAANYPPRWAAAGATMSPDRTRFAVNGDGALAYHHLIGGGARDRFPHELPRGASQEPQLITDFEAYNQPYGIQSPRVHQPKDCFDLSFHFCGHGNDQRGIDGVVVNWVGDLMLEATLDLKALAGTCALHLTEATREYRCEFTFDGDKKLRLYQGDKKLAEIDNPVTAPRAVDVRFANFDDRLVVWIDGKTVFGDGVPVDPLGPDENGPTKADLEPAKISFANLRGEVRHLKLYRDIYYTQPPPSSEYWESRSDFDMYEAESLDEPTLTYPFPTDDESMLNGWRLKLRRTMIHVQRTMQTGEPEGKARLYDIPKGKYFMCGDNSPRSYDSRAWAGTNFVPRQCVLGKALVVYYPLHKLPWDLKFVW